MLRAAFVPDGERPPPEFGAEFRALRIPATLDPATGQITCPGAGMSFGNGLPAYWVPDGNQGGDDEAAVEADDGGPSSAGG